MIGQKMKSGVIEGKIGSYLATDRTEADLFTIRLATEEQSDLPTKGIESKTNSKTRKEISPHGSQRYVTD